MFLHICTSTHHGPINYETSWNYVERSSKKVLRKVTLQYYNVYAHFHNIHFQNYNIFKKKMENKSPASMYVNQHKKSLLPTE